MGGTNLYQIARNQPLNYLDRNGLIPITAPVVGIGELLAAAAAVFIIVDGLDGDFCTSWAAECVATATLNPNPDYGCRKPCSECYRECVNDRGVWPFYKCPL